MPVPLYGIARSFPLPFGNIATIFIPEEWATVLLAHSKHVENKSDYTPEERRQGASDIERKCVGRDASAPNESKRAQSATERRTQPLDEITIAGTTS